MASEVKEETNSTPSDTKNDVDEKVKDEDSKLKDGEKDSAKNESKEESGKSASTEETKKESKSKKEEEDDDDEEEEEEDGEEEVGLLDRPVEVTGCRARKKVERLIVSFSTPKEKQEFQEGKGKKLGDCAKIEFQIQKSKVQDLKPLHKILFNRTGSANEIKKNIRKFSGFPFEQDSVEFNRKKTSLDKMTMSVLKQICSVLDIERGGTKGEITSRIMNFLLKPEDSGKKVPSAKKKASKDEKKSTKKGKSEKKSKADKNENSAEESEKSDDDDSTGGDASMGGTDEENEDENESDEEPKKKSKDTKPAKGKSKADKVKKEEKKSKGSKRKADEDSDASSADEPVAKKSKMPTDEEISKLVKQILESADLQEITMKKVIKQVSDAYPDFDLSHKKAFIKQTIKSVIS